MIKIVAERWRKIQKLHLKKGAHEEDSTFCIMEAAAYVAGEPWSDHPKCVPPVIGAFFRSWNDSLPTDADRDRLLKPFILRIIGLPMDMATEERRGILICDWMIRVLFVEILKLAELDAEADQFAQHSEYQTVS